MAGIIDYKQKYQELKAKFMSSVESAWNDGFQHGMDAAQTDQAQQQAQQADAMAQSQGGGMGEPGQPGEEQPDESAAPGQEPAAPASENPNGDELGQHIEKLESMLGKSEISGLELQDLKKTLNDIRSLQVQINLTKSLNSIKSTKMAKSYVGSFSPKTKANLPDPAKKALNLQKDIIANIFNKWDADANKAVTGIESFLNTEGLSKKE